MALARIITHSDLCARELAFHLLGRGYTVEIVSPDSIPDNLADLELRVENHSGDELVANVAAHGGQHAASLEFLHRVKAPVEEVILTPPVSVKWDVSDLLAEASSDVELSSEGDPELCHQPLAERCCADEEAGDEGDGTVRSALCPSLSGDQPLRPADSTSLENEAGVATSVETEPAKPGSPTDERPADAIGYFARQTSSIASPFAGPAVVLPVWQPQPLDRAVEWKSIAPAALTLAGVVLLALCLAFGIRPTAKAPMGGAATASKVTTPMIRNAPSTVSGRPAPIEKPNAALSNPARSTASNRQTRDMLAPDTITYPNGRDHAVAKAKPLRARSGPIKHTAGDIAADTTTYLDGASYPKTAK